MRSLSVFAAALVVGLLVLTALPIGYAQPLPPRNTDQYLPFVFRAAETPIATIAPTLTPTQTSQPGTPTASPTSTPVVTSTSTPVFTSQPTATPSATTGTSFPPVGAGTPTRTPVPATRSIFTNGQDLWNCTDFGTWADADVVFDANKPGDPNKLDQDSDDIPCEALPGAPPQ